MDSAHEATTCRLIDTESGYPSTAELVLRKEPVTAEGLDVPAAPYGRVSVPGTSFVVLYTAWPLSMPAPEAMQRVVHDIEVDIMNRLPARPSTGTYAAPTETFLIPAP